ncbi:MAG: VanW family protein [Clostridia bacterium]
MSNQDRNFLFNNTTGARTEEKGYKPATAYLNGEVVQEPGGGVCQVSSTLYNAVVFAGLKSTERRIPHTSHRAVLRYTGTRMRQSATA